METKVARTLLIAASPHGKTPFAALSNSGSHFEFSRAWFSRSCFTKSDDKLPIVLLLEYYTYNRGATTQTLSAGGPRLIAPGGTPGKIKWPELGVTELRFRDRLDPADSD